MSNIRIQGPVFAAAKILAIVLSMAWASPGQEGADAASKAPTDARLDQLASRCAADLPWCSDWSTAQARAAKEKRVVLVWVWAYGSFALNDRLASGPLMDADIAQLVSDHCLLLRYRKGMKAPFVSAKSFGLGPNTFGHALLAVDARGRVLDQVRSISPQVVHDFLVSLIAKHGRQVVSSKTDAPSIRARALIRHGKLKEAMQILKESEGAEEDWLRGHIYRRWRQAAPAEVALRRALATAPADKAEIRLELGRVLLRRQNSKEALELLAQAAASKKNARVRDEAQFWSGLAALSEERGTAADAAWSELVQRSPQTRNGRRAALWCGAVRRGLKTVPVTWIDEGIIDEAGPLRAADEKKSVRAAVARRLAARWLIDHQRKDGSWVDPGEAVHTRAEFGHTYAAFAALALSRESSKDAQKAVSRALEFIIRAFEAEAKAEVSAAPQYMDYKIWRDAGFLWLYASLPEGPQREKLRSIAAARVASLVEKQRGIGGWSYVVRMQLERKGPPPDMAMSFMTAFVMLALQDAKDAGLEVPESSLKRAAACLHAMKTKTGDFAYSMARGGGGGMAGALGGVGRRPLCTLALLPTEAGSIDEVKAAFDFLADHGHALSKERHKALMHTGVDGLGSHYILFDWAQSVRALRVLPERERRAFAPLLRKLVMQTRLQEGAFADTLVNGRACGTALALWCLQELEEVLN